VSDRPDIVVILTDEERAAPPYEPDDLRAWRRRVLTGRRWFDDHGVSFTRHYTGSLACVPARPTLFTGQYPDVHGVTQTDGLGKEADDSRMRWLRPDEVPTLGHWFRHGGYDTHYDGKWHLSHADLTDPVTGRPLATNTADGEVLTDAVRAYLDADPLGPFGFSGWVGPEPHGAGLANAGIRRDPLVADRVVAWLEDRYRRRRAGDPAALRPFLLVASFVNPHDIVLWPAWARRCPVGLSPLDPPPVPPAPTAGEDLASKPAIQIAYRAAYPTGYGPRRIVERRYRRGSQAYRDLYHRLHAEVDGPIDRVRRAVTEGGSTHAVLVRTADHGDLLGAHGGLHQKWCNLYDEATRVPFTVVRVGERPTTAREVHDMVTSHVDVVPTVLAAAGIDVDATASALSQRFSEVHPLPGRDLLPVVDGDAAPDRDRVVYLMTRDQVLEGDTGASAAARIRGRRDDPPPPLRIRVPAHVAGNLEGVVARVPSAVPGADGHLWKLVRTFDDPATWSEPGRRHLADTGPGGPRHRSEPLPDQWELYDLDADPVEARNRAGDPAYAAVAAHLRSVLDDERARAVPARNRPWPYATSQYRHRRARRPRPPARLARRLLRRLGLHPDDAPPFTGDVRGRRALIVATNHGVLDLGRPTGVFASELTAAYYEFLDAGMEVDVASPAGGVIPVDPLSLRAAVRTPYDDRLLADDILRARLADSPAVADLDVDRYDVVYLAGGWGAAFDFATSTALAAAVARADRRGAVIGGVCHGPLGLVGATTVDGRPLVEGRRLTAVTDKQVRELGIDRTPYHPEAELRRRGARFEAATAFRDPLANHWTVDGNLVTGQNQNAAPHVARLMMGLVSGAASTPTPPAQEASAP
jgi:arylsulfatase A-like enzyme/putative intracellular protease/amidase